MNIQLEISNTDVELETEVLQESSNVLDEGQLAELNTEAIDEGDNNIEHGLDSTVQGDDERLELGGESDEGGLDAVNSDEDRVNEFGELLGDGVDGVGAEDDGDVFREGAEEVELSLEGDEDGGDLGNEDLGLGKSDGLGAELSDDGLNLDLDGDEEGTNGLDVTAGDLASGTTGNESLDLSLKSGKGDILLGAAVVGVLGDDSVAEISFYGGDGTGADFTAGDLETSAGKSTDSDTEGLDDSTDGSTGTSDNLGGVTDTGGGREGDSGEGKEGKSELHC